ncbi:ead/Ea22-like family protein [Salmonella enterica]
MTIDKQALLGPDKHSNQHKLSRLIAEANSAEIRDIAEAVEQYTDQLIAALEAAEKRIAEQREYYEGVISDGRKRIQELEARVIVLPQRLSPEGYHIDEAYMVDDTEGEYLDRDAVIDAIRAAGIGVKGE